MRIDINRTVNLPKLQMEMLAADLIEPSAYFGELYFIAKDDVDMNLVQQIIDAHDPTPIPAPKTETEILKERLEATEQALLQIMFEGMM